MHRPSWAGYHLKGAYSREWGKTKALVSGAFRTSVSPVFLYGVSGNQCLNLVCWVGPDTTIGSY